MHAAAVLGFACSLSLVSAAHAVAPQAPVGTAPVESTPYWPGYGRDPFHNAKAPLATQTLNRVLWSTPVDLQPVYTGPYLLIHYGSPLIAGNGTVVVTVKTGTTGGFRVEGHAPGNGALLWTMATDYILPSSNWTPSCGSTLTPTNLLVTPAGGGTVMVRWNADAPSSPATRVAFYGLSNYQANPSGFNSTVFITTPITSDLEGNVYFGFRVTGTPPISITSGIARISSTGVGSWVSAVTASGDSTMRRVPYNCAPAVSRDGRAIYVAIHNRSSSGTGVGYLVKLDSRTLAMIARIRLRDPRSTTTDANLTDDSTASPSVGPDGDVYYGVLAGGSNSNNSRGWMLHFDGALTQVKTPGAFGWDDTASIVPRAAVPSYAGSSPYLILTKYNNYGGGAGGDGLNKVAVLDPNTPFTDPISGATVMSEVLTILGPTPDPSVPGGRVEWCINTAAVDVTRHSAIVNSEDGKVYRWDFATNTLTENVVLTSGIGEAYTPTIVGPDGVVYAISNAILFAVGQ